MQLIFKVGLSVVILVSIFLFYGINKHEADSEQSNKRKDSMPENKQESENKHGHGIRDGEPVAAAQKINVNMKMKGDDGARIKDDKNSKDDSKPHQRQRKMEPAAGSDQAGGTGAKPKEGPAGRRTAIGGQAEDKVKESDAAERYAWKL